jgi:hypothetical protein
MCFGISAPSSILSHAISGKILVIASTVTDIPSFMLIDWLWWGAMSQVVSPQHFHLTQGELEVISVRNMRLNSFVLECKGSWCSSVSTAPVYRLGDWAIEVRSLAVAKWFFPLASMFTPALGPSQPLIQWVPRTLSLVVKHGRGVTLTTHPYLVPRSWMSRYYTFRPPKRLLGM